jgi:PAS domain S-box-containing protein
MKRFLTSQRRSISKEVTLGLIVIVAAVSSIALVISYAQDARRAERQLEAKANEYIAFLKNILVLPLWNYDFETIEAVGRTYLQNDFVAGIHIYDGKGVSRFSRAMIDEPTSVTRNAQLYYHGISVGRVEIALTATPLTELRRQFFWSFGLTVAINLLSLILLTGLLLRRSLKKPLTQLNDIVTSYSAGNSTFQKQDIPYVELRSFVETLQRMGEQIDDQMTVIQQAERKYRSIFENALEGIYQSKPDGRIISANPAFAAILGYDSPQQLIEEISDIGTQHYVDENQRRTLIRQLAQGKVVEAFEVQLYRKDRRIIWVSINSRPIYDEAGHLSHFEGLVQDITQRKNAEMRLRQAQKMEAMGTLAGGIAHDFNNILGVIIGCSELALNRIPAVDSAKQDLEKVVEAGLRAKSLVRQILTFSRQSESEAKPLILPPLIKEITRFLRSSLPSTIDIRLNLYQADSVILADPTEIQQILMNLCTNAAHAMAPNGGTLEIGLSEEQIGPEDNPYLSELPAGAYVKLSVADSGPGIPRELAHRIFDPFFTTKKLGEGTGLGLSVVHGIVKKNGGGVFLQSPAGRGAVFDVFWPRIEHPDIEIGDKQLADLPKGNERILLVDDEKQLVEILRRMLSELGYRVRSETDSRQALQRIHDRPEQYDLVIADHTMPHLTGLRLAEELRAVRPDLPIVLCTGMKGPNLEDEAPKAGVSKVISKPISRERLARVIREVLDD